MKRLLFCAAAVLAVVSTARARTVGWWRFGDLGADGGKTTAGMVLTNSVDSTRHPVKPCSFSGYTAGSQVAYMPSLVKLDGAVPSLSVYDPVSGESHAVSTVLSCPWGGDGSKLSGGATIAYADELLGRGEGQSGCFTFECFVKVSQASIGRSASMAAIAGQVAPSGLGAWSLMIYNGRLWARAAAEQTSAPEGYLAATLDSGSSGKVSADTWHHVAFVYKLEPTKRTFTLYLDYVAVASNETAGNDFGPIIPRSDTEPIYLGKAAAVNTDRSLGGEMAEARISDAALDPSQFLRFHEDFRGDRIAQGDADTLIWNSCDTASVYDSFLASCPNLMTAWHTNLTAELVLPSGGVPAVFTNETLTGWIRKDDVSPALVNAGSLALLTNGTARSSYVSLGKILNRLPEDSFTVEFFAKTARPVEQGTGNLNRSYGLFCSGFCKIMVNQDGGRLFLRVKSAQGNSDINLSRATVAVDDGNWHHIAYVYDAETTESRFYCDGLLAGSIERPPKIDMAQAVTFGYANDGTVQQLDGLVDELRITRRALTADEFMATFEESDKTLAWIRFEGDTKAWPYGNEATLGSYVGDSTPPKFTDARAAEIDLMKHSDERIANRRAMKFEGGSAYWPRMRLIERSNVTIEFFWRPYECAAPWPLVLGLSNGAGADVFVTEQISETHPDYVVPWQISYRGKWGATGLVLLTSTIRPDGTTIRTSTDISPEIKLQDAAAPASGYSSPIVGGVGFDGRWHHVAVTLEEIEIDGVVNTRTTTYWDYQQFRQTTAEGKINMGDTGHWLTVGRNGQPKRLAKWDIDEIRITDGILTPDEFLHTSRRGFFLIAR